MANEPKGNEPKAPSAAAPRAAAPSAASKITFEQFTESTMGAVLRAVDARKLPHQPIIIGIIWHPGLGGGGGGYGGGQQTCGFASTVKPFFTDCYHEHMSFMFD